jgi:hypothetical protein
MPYGYKFQIGVQRVSEPNPNRPRGGLAGPALALIVALALTVVGLLVWPHPVPIAQAPAAHIAPAPSMPAATATPPAIVRVTGQDGAVCILPGGKPIGPVDLVKVP